MNENKLIYKTKETVTRHKHIVQLKNMIIKYQNSLEVSEADLIMPKTESATCMTGHQKLRRGAKGKRIKRSTEYLQDLWVPMKRNNNRIMKFWKGKKKRKGTECLLETVMAEIFLGREKGPGGPKVSKSVQPKQDYTETP